MRKKKTVLSCPDTRASCPRQQLSGIPRRPPMRLKRGGRAVLDRELAREVMPRAGLWGEGKAR
jgi:hypothetical protein